MPVLVHNVLFRYFFNMVLSFEKWVDKVAIVTGASSGSGAAIAKQLVENGVKVVGIARRVERIEDLAKKLEGQKGTLYAVKADLTKESDILEAFSWAKKNVGPVSILINSAGVAANTTLIDGDTQKWKNIVDVNIIGLSIATREAVKEMRANSIDGHIVHINSILGHIVPNFPSMNVLPASKHAVTALTETLRNELKNVGSKIKITSVSPGVVKTEFFEAADLGKTIPVEALPSLEPGDVADAVVYALSTPPHVQVHEIIVRPVGEMY